MARRIIDQWNTKTIGLPTTGDGLDVTDLETVSDAIHVQQENLENMKMINLVGQATNTQSQSGPLPNTFHIHKMNGVNGAVSWVDFASLGGPNNGIWVVHYVIVSYTGGSGTGYFQMRVGDGTYSLEWYMGATTSSTYFNANLDSQWDEIGSKRWGGGQNAGGIDLGIKPSGTFDADSMDIHVVCYRVR